MKLDILYIKVFCRKINANNHLGYGFKQKCDVGNIFRRRVNFMIEVYTNLWVGNQFDYESKPSFFIDWFVVHACKEPYHRKLLGYSGHGAPKESPYYLYGFDSLHNLVLNIVDADSPIFFNDKMMNFAVRCCIDNLSKGKMVLIHCNQGESRAPSLAMLVLKRMGILPSSFTTAIEEYKKIYPPYSPSKGIFEYIKGVWEHDN